MDSLINLVAFLALICILVAVHEYGHFWAARRCGVKVLRFSIGFGKVLWRKRDKKGTEFAISLIPLGGYVQMWDGEAEIAAPINEALSHKTVWQRMFIVLAGPLANFLFAIFAYWLVFTNGIPTLKPVIGEILPNTIAAQAKLPSEFEIKQVANQTVSDWEEVALSLVANVGKANIEIAGSTVGEDRLQHFVLDLTTWQIESNQHNPLTTLGIKPKAAKIEPTIQSVMDNSPAQHAGINAGDVIVAINGQTFDWDFLTTEIQKGQPITLTINRQDQQKNIEITPLKSQENQRFIIGIVPLYQPLSSQYRTELKYDILTAFWKSVEKVAHLTQTIIQFIANLISGDLSLKNMGGPISMAKGAGTTAQIGIIYYLSFMALISVNLGVMNLFPILPLDGGQMVLLGAEAIRGKKVSPTIQTKFQQIGILFVLALMVFTLFNDLIHF